MSDRESSVEKQIEICVKNIFAPILDRISINESGRTEMGANYSGDVIFATVSGIGQRGQAETYNIVIKNGKTSKKLREKIPLRESFENELFVYDKILPAFERFQQEKNIAQPFNNFPKTFGQLLTDAHEILVLEDLKDHQFYLWDRTQPMDFEHLTCVVRAYGRFHALSFALRDQRADLFEALTTSLCDVLKIIGDIFKSEKYSPFDEIIDELRRRGDLKTVRQIEKLQDEHSFEANIVDRNYSVIVHGDCWNNNFMFKNDGKLQVSILDWQICRFSSPIFDLSHFIFSCISADDLANNLDRITNEYYESFSDFLLQLGSDPSKLLPFPAFLAQWKKYARYGVYLMAMILRFCLSTSEEAPRLDECAENGEPFTDGLKIKLGKTDEYIARTCGIVKYAIEKELI